MLRFYNSFALSTKHLFHRYKFWLKFAVQLFSVLSILNCKKVKCHLEVINYDIRIVRKLLVKTQKKNPILKNTYNKQLNNSNLV